MTDTQTTAATETPTYAPGTPIWVDLASPDLDASKAFYGSLFGWDAYTFPDPAAGGYTMFLLNGKNVAGLGPIFNEGQPPAWATYISTDNVDETAQKVRDAGGQVVAGPMDVFNAGRMAVFVDSTGAHFCAWQPGEHKGAEAVNQPGTFGWNELNTRDLDGAKRFYNAVFGWEGETSPMGDSGMAYTEWKLNGRSIGGAMDLNQTQAPADVPPHWLTYFIVDDCDGATARVQELGGNVILPGMDIEPGRFAIVQDPQGAVFAVFSMRAQS